MTAMTALDGVIQLHKFTVDDVRVSCVWDPGSTTVHLRARGPHGDDQTAMGFLSVWDPDNPQLTIFPQYQAWVRGADHRWDVVCRQAQHAYRMRTELLAACAKPWRR